jgi:glycine cleavage system H protein
MPPEIPDSLVYQRARFTTRLPMVRRYSPSHFWLAPEEGGLWRIGMTKFATRMLGEMVDHHFEPAPGTPVVPGQAMGWIEGFKALTELYCVASGIFAGENPLLNGDISLISRDPYGDGWLYRVQGEPDAAAVDAKGYAALLDATIDRLSEAECRP